AARAACRRTIRRTCLRAPDRAARARRHAGAAVKRGAMIPTGEATLGPFFPPRYIDAGANDLTKFEGRAARGAVIEIHGRVAQEDGKPLENLVLEIWQADAAGIYR